MYPGPHAGGLVHVSVGGEQAPDESRLHFPGAGQDLPGDDMLVAGCDSVFLGDLQESGGLDPASFRSGRSATLML